MLQLIFFCRYGVGNGSILFSRVTCDGNENHILRCDTVGYSSLASTCTHDQDVAIICCESDVIINIYFVRQCYKVLNMSEADYQVCSYCCLSSTA